MSSFEADVLSWLSDSLSEDRVPSMSCQRPFASGVISSVAVCNNVQDVCSACSDACRWLGESDKESRLSLGDSIWAGKSSSVTEVGLGG